MIKIIETSHNCFPGPTGHQIQMRDTVKNGSVREMHEAHFEQCNRVDREVLQVRKIIDRLEERAESTVVVAPCVQHKADQ